MSECSHNCSECGAECSERQEQTDFSEQLNPNSSVKKVIGVVSGKGGVGKSLVTSLLASQMQKKGFQCAIMDADITGPSIPKMFGVHEKAMGDGEEIFPVASPDGVKLMSINLLLENETEPVIWRGPVIAGAVTQFWTDVRWGDVDYMFVDMPPGTGDVPLTVFQSLPVDGIIVVASPQELVEMIVAKAVNMAEMLNIPILGLVENMAYFECPDCHSRHYIFGNTPIGKILLDCGIDIGLEIPVDPNLAAACDKGEIWKYDAQWLEPLASLVEEK
ncbi:MAG: Mrp/NBP35 family ATP-binding protein [Clostridiales bacterium]|nr:Mrp/NBP35 family ATP-binding protein [Clostridiales bacterium]